MKPIIKIIKKHLQKTFQDLTIENISQRTICIKTLKEPSAVFTITLNDTIIIFKTIHIVIEHLSYYKNQEMIQSTRISISNPELLNKITEIIKEITKW